MSLHVPTYAGDGIVDLGTVPSGAARTARNAAIFQTDVVHGNIGAQGEPVIDFTTIEAQARAARDAWIGSALKSLYGALVRKFARGGQPAMKDHLAA